MVSSMNVTGEHHLVPYYMLHSAAYFLRSCSFLFHTFLKTMLKTGLGLQNDKSVFCHKKVSNARTIGKGTRSISDVKKSI